MNALRHRGIRLLAAVALAAVTVIGPVVEPAVGGSAYAAPGPPPSCDNPDALGVASGFSEFVRGDGGRISDSEGRVAIGGNATLGSAVQQVGFSVGSGQPVDSVGVPLPDDRNRHDLIVGGTLDAYRVDVIHAGARYGSLASEPGSVTSSINGSVTAGPPTQYADGSGAIDFAAEFAGLQAKADAWGSLPGTGDVTLTGGRLDLVGDAAGLNVFPITATQLDSSSSVRIRVPAGATILVNVSGRSVDLSAGPLATVSIWDPITGQYIVDDHFIGGRPVPSTTWLTLRQSLLWNFPDATEILKNSVSWPGTILAPQAHLQFGRGTTIGPGHVDGSIVVESVDSAPGAETHDMTFVGLCLPEEPAPTGAITLRKVVTGPAPAVDTAFSFDVDCGVEGGRHSVRVTVAAGATSGTARLADLPVGVTCAVDEPDPPPGWVLGPVMPRSVIVPAADEPPVSVTATNSRQVGSLRLVKRLDGPAAVSGSVTLHVVCSDGTARDILLTVPAGSTSTEATIAGVAVGSRCTVTESASDPDWSAVGVTPAAVTIGDPDAPPVVVTARNTRRLGAIALTKVTTVAPTADTTFRFALDCDGSAYDRTIAVTVPAGATRAQAAPVTGIPYGTTCSVTETDLPAGWQVHDVTPSAVTVGAGGTSTITVTATDGRDLAGLELVKEVTGPADGIGHLFGLHVSCSDGVEADVAIAVPSGATSGRAALGGITPGATCTVTEPDQPPGFEPVTITPATVTVGAAGAPPAVVTATDRHTIGTLTVEKRLAEPATAGTSFGLTLDCDGTAYDRSVTLAVAAGADGASTSIAGLPVGLHCDLTEPVVPPPYRLVDITPTDGVTVGTSATATLVADNAVTTGAVRIVKRLLDGPADDALTVHLRLSCTGPSAARNVTVVVPAGRNDESVLAGGLPAGARCGIIETRPAAPYREAGVTPSSVVVGTDEPVTITVRNQLRAYPVRVTKRTDGAPPTTDTDFAFLLACNDPAYDRSVTVVVRSGATSATDTAATVPVTVSCTVSEPEKPGWLEVSRTPVDGTATPAAPHVTVINRAEGGTGVAATGPVLLQPLLRLAGLLLLAGATCCCLSAGRYRRRRRAPGR